jgi:tetratricopeptide (TPR) repeat protein
MNRRKDVIMKRIYPATLLTVILLCAFISAVQAQSPQQLLDQYIADLQKNPNDYALREKIIRHVQTMKPAPAIPLEAEKFEGRAEFAIKNAKTEADFLDAAREYEKALLVAPWASAYYFNQGIAFEKAGTLKEAKQSFEFYLLAMPNAQDARDVRKRIAGLEYAIEKATREMSRQAIVAQIHNKSDDWIVKMDGRRYAMSTGTGFTMIYDVKGKTLVYGSLYNNQYTEKDRTEIRGREMNITDPRRIIGGPVVACTIMFSEDGSQITQRVRYSDGDVRDYVYRWQK